MSASARTVAVVSDDSLYVPLRYLPLDWELKQYQDIAALTRALIAGERVDGVILADRYTGATIDDVLNHVGRLLLNGIPTALVMYAEETFTEITSVWPQFEVKMQQKYEDLLQARRGAGEELLDEELTCPSDVTAFVLVQHQGGARKLMMDFGPHLLNPFVPSDLQSIDDVRYSNAFPIPGDNGFAVTESVLGKRRGKVVTIVSDKGGCGKTTVSMMFAAAVADASAAAGKPLRVVVVDMDRQSQISAILPGAKHTIHELKSNSTDEQVAAALHTPIPEMPNLQFLVGAAEGEDHRSVRTIALYEHVVAVLAQELADLVVIDGSVGVTDDEVTMWAQRESDAVYYILTEASNELKMAASAYNGTIRPKELGGVGLDPAKFALVENLYLDGDPGVRREFERALEAHIPGVPIHACIPHGGVRVRRAAQEHPEGGLLRLAVSDTELNQAFRDWVHRLYPEMTYDGKSKEFAAPTKKKGILGR